MAMDDRYNRSDFNRQERYQDFDHRDRGRYNDDMMMDRRDNSRGIGADRDGQVRGRDPPPTNDAWKPITESATQERRDRMKLSFVSSSSTSQTGQRDMAETAETPGAEALTSALTRGKPQTELSQAALWASEKGLNRVCCWHFYWWRDTFVLSGKEVGTGTPTGRWTEKDHGKVGIYIWRYSSAWQRRLKETGFILFLMSV